MDFEQLLDNLWGFDAEIFTHDSLFVFINYKTKQERIFHNCAGDDIQRFFDECHPILMGYNCNNYDKHILRCWLGGMSPEELKGVNDYIIAERKNGWDIQVPYVRLPVMWDLFNEINPRKSLKEIEGNLRLDITETTVPFDLPIKWTEEQKKEVIYYCRHDVLALFPLFDKLKTEYKAKFIISKLGKMDSAFALSQTNANLTAILLKADRKQYNDHFSYVYPDCIDKSKIPQKALDYFDDIIAHNDLNYTSTAPEIEYRDIILQLGIGGGHAFKKQGTYFYDRRLSKKLLCNWDFTSLYPNLIRLFGYSSRSQADVNGYVNLLRMRMKAKKGLLEDDFLKPLDLTNADVNIGLKLPLNAYSGGLRAKFNALYDNLQGFSICTTGQLIIMQLIHDLEKIPTLEMVSANTDAVMYEVSPEYKSQADTLIHDLEKLTGLEMEEDNIVRIVMANVNNYCELVQTGENDYAINYKGGNFECNSIKKNLKLKWDKETETWSTSFTDDIKTNSRTIVGEALLKNLLLDIPVEETINNCDDIFRFQIISHLGSTYEKCVQESPSGDVELQRNNRIYAGKEPSGTIVKVKYDGQRDTLANCPENPIVDNDNKCTIDKVDKKWYIKLAQQRVEDFLGTGKQILKGRKKTMKKDELIAENERLQKEIESLKEGVDTMTPATVRVMLLKKINEFRKQVRSYDFKLDKVMDDKHGGGEYSSINQVYNCVQDLCLSCGLDFQFDCVEEIRFEKNGFVSSVGAPRHIVETRCLATLTDIDTGASKQYCVLGAGSDTIDKGLSASITMAFRQWFTKNFSPKQNFPWDDEDTPTEVSESPQPKTPIFIPPKVKEEIVEKVVNTEQQETTKDVSDTIAEMIMEMRMLTGDENYGATTLSALQQGTLNDVQIDSARTTLEIKLAGLKAGA